MDIRVHNRLRPHMGGNGHDVFATAEWVVKQARSAWPHIVVSRDVLKEVIKRLNGSEPVRFCVRSDDGQLMTFTLETVHQLIDEERI